MVLKFLYETNYDDLVKENVEKSLILAVLGYDRTGMIIVKCAKKNVRNDFWYGVGSVM